MKFLIFTTLLITLMSCGETKQDELKSPPLNLSDVSKPALSELEGDKKISSALKSEKLEAFGSTDDWHAYIERLKTAQEQESDRGGGLKGCANCDMAEAPVSAAPSSGAAAEAGGGGITNNQEAGVDEGGIVKVIGDYLVVLRRGRLFTIRANIAQNGALELIDTADAFPPQHSTATWYDELLVHENKIIVVGYSYGYGATEIGKFSLGEDGAITHQATYFLRSNDYYSSRNYASRLVGNKLVFYMPFHFFNRYSDEQQITLPGQGKLLDSGKVSVWNDIIDVATIIQPIEETTDPLLHTIAVCDLGAQDFTCHATSVVGPYARSFYVSPNAVYLWTSSEEGASVYRLPLDGAAPSALLAEGTPNDQFSFKETDDGSLHVLLRESGFGDAMWAPEFRDGGVALLSLPLSLFSAQPAKVAESEYVILPQVKGYQMHNRFVGSRVLYGSERGWDREADDRQSVHIYDVKTKSSKTIALGHDVQRIEAIGNNAIVIGSHQEDLVFSSIMLNDEPRVADSFTLEKSAQGEHRSHGFFYKPQSETTGLLGLPTRDEGSFFGELTESSASVVYLSVENGHLSSLGALESTVQTNIDDNCKASCVDWYGNSRPIFLGTRIFALLGYDLVEGQLQNGKINELRRLNYTPPPESPEERAHE